MESMPRSLDDLPALYRSILDLVEELERCDGRAEANRIRSEALAAYATAWDLRQQRRLARLETRLQRSIAARRRHQRSWLRLP
jgi:hypothetical protein